MILTVYRVEHKETRNGPFQTPHPFTQKLAAKVNPKAWPFPSNDGFLLQAIPFSYVFGCPSIQLLKSLFTFSSDKQEHKRTLKALKQLGFQVGEFKVRETSCKVGRSKSKLCLTHLMLLNLKRAFVITTSPLSWSKHHVRYFQKRVQ